MKAVDCSKQDPNKEANKSINLPNEHTEKLFQLLVKHEDLFQGKHSNWTGEWVMLWIKLDATPK